MHKTAPTPLETVRKWPKMSSISPSPTEKHEALDEVLRSATFFRADQLRNFLRYICEMEFAGRGNELCESLIGVEAFGRPADYSPTEDASVRRRAGDLRDKLQEVYATELADSPIRIELPKGKFVPRFIRVAPENGMHASAGLTPVAHTSLRPRDGQSLENAAPRQLGNNIITARLDTALLDRTKSWRRLIVFWFAAGCVVGALMVATSFLAYRWLHSPEREPSATQVTARAEAPLETRAEPSAETRVAPRAETSRPVTAEDGKSYEAEAAGNTMNGITGPFPCARCSGRTSVRSIGKLRRNYLILNNITAAKTRNYQMMVFYLLKGSRSFFISVNDGPAIELPLTGKYWHEVAKASVTVPLKAGSNSIKFYNDHGYAPDLDRVVIR